MAGLAFWALGVWSGLMYQHDEAAFRVQAVPAAAVIDQIYTSAASSHTVTFNEYATVHFDAHGQTAHAHVLLVAGCQGTCVTEYNEGQALTVYYVPGNLAFARLSIPAPPTWTDYLPEFLIFGLFGTIFLVAAAINMGTAKDLQQRKL
jgi:hypothetical protein